MENQQVLSLLLFFLQIIIALKTLHALNNHEEDKEKKNQSSKNQDAQNKDKEQTVDQTTKNQHQIASQQYLANQSNKDQHLSSQFYGNQTSSGPSFSNFDIDVSTTQRQRTDSFSVPNPSSQIIQNQLKLKTTVNIKDLQPYINDNYLQTPNFNTKNNIVGQNKSRKNSENIPQTPNFQPEKSKKLQLNLQTNSYQNPKKIASSNNQDFNLNQQNNSMMEVNYDLDQESQEMHQEELPQPPQFKTGMSIKEIMKVETPEKKKILQQNKMLFQDNSINNNISPFINPKNFVQSPDSNFYTRQNRQSSVQEDKRNKHHFINQSQILKEKEAKVIKNDEKIRDAHWIQPPTSKPSRKYQEKRDQNLSQQYRDIPNPSFDDRAEQLDSKVISRKRHVFDSFAHAYESDDMEDEQTEKNHSICKILQVQKKRKEELFSKFIKQKEAEKKNQILFNAPYSNNMNTLVTINHREQEKIDLEEAAKVEKPIFIKPADSLILNKNDNLPQQPSESNFKLPGNENTSLFSQNQTKPASINIIIPDKQIQANQDEKSTPLDKKDEGIKLSVLNPPPAPKAAQAAPLGLFANLPQSSLVSVDKKEDNNTAVQAVKSTPLFNLQESSAESLKKSDGIKEIQESSQEKNLTTPQQTITSSSQVISNPFDSQQSLFSKSQTPQQAQTPQQLQTQIEIQNEIAQKKGLPKKQTSAGGLFGNLASAQTEQKKDDVGQPMQTNTGLQIPSIQASIGIAQPLTPANTGFLFNMPKQQQQQQQNIGTQASNNVTERNISSFDKSIEPQKALPPKNKEQTQPENKFGGEGGLFGNLGKNQISLDQSVKVTTTLTNEVKEVQAAETMQTTTQDNSASELFKTPFSLDSQSQVQQQAKNITDQKNDNHKVPTPVQPQPQPQSQGLFGNLSSNQSVTEQKNFLNQPNIPSSLFPSVSNSNGLNQGGGLFGKKDENTQQQIAEKKTEQPKNLFSGLIKDGAVGGEQAIGGFLKQEANNKSNGLGSGLAFLQNPGDDKPKEAKNLFGQSISNINQSGGIFDKSNNNPLKDKQQQQQQLNKDFEPLPQKAINQENGQLQTEVNGLNSLDKQQNQPVSQSLFTPSSQPVQNSLFQLKEQPKVSTSQLQSSSQGGLFGSQNQSLSQQTNQSEPNKNTSLFGNLQSQNKGGLFGSNGTGLFANQSSNSNQQNGLFGNTSLFSKPAESATQ
ncbi:hypothetical protein TTHERM_00312730 (macronuclear) [Tetrahymena thermophila SB210]|uniref:Transmembrane protein n=1 Tax=Tetrahymena thermophila (strain SB210) TaxID=312017 RepID=Q22KK8_TETTS|nr:hypothetical protein TTHERM_00312730 [Tetrahymena thermophila SB210]EAR85791.2 hypothetical protein TTHERM_00312730 [Tetrahymena thermophila SB210]|eukprot:XP_001033454.2 hypothetical protein TTHERM_00312730 [Tetrahymena thermophila SB210]